MDRDWESSVFLWGPTGTEETTGKVGSKPDMERTLHKTVGYRQTRKTEVLQLMEDIPRHEEIYTGFEWDLQFLNTLRF